MNYIKKKPPELAGKRLEQETKISKINYIPILPQEELIRMI